MTHHDLAPTTTWVDLPTHRRWLLDELDRLLAFAETAVHPDGGFAWLDASGSPLFERGVETWITCRMTHVFSLAHLLGRPGAARLADHGLAGLDGPLRDAQYGGWFAGTGAQAQQKEAYAHAFVVLACSSATAARRPGAAELLTEALAVMETRFWQPEEGLVAEIWDRSWTDLEDYRGVNANMHCVEAFLAAADVTGEVRWRDRAHQIVTRIVHGFARGNDWRLPEHFDAGWQQLPDYNRDQPDHPFRPYGVTIGHLLEWARLALHLRAALGDQAPGWLLDDAAALFDRAVSDGWDVDGAEGFVYTTDWDGTPVVRERLHWVVTEAVAAAAVLHRVTGRPEYERWYRTWWDHAAALLIDREEGSWHHQLDRGNRPSESVWEGKPDVYHAVQATLIPMLPLAPTLATALRQGPPVGG